jgi:hypothetical protein
MEMKRVMASLGIFAGVLMCLCTIPIRAWAYDANIENDTNFQIKYLISYGLNTSQHAEIIDKGGNKDFENDNWSESGLCWYSIFVMAWSSPNADSAGKSYNCEESNFNQIQQTYPLGQCSDIKIKINMNHDCEYTFEVE